MLHFQHQKRGIMDEFDNFFDNGNNDNEKDKTPIYHTPTPQEPPKRNIGSIFAIVISVVMCLVVLVNVVVLASLKNQIAEEYSARIAGDMKDQYQSAVNDAIADKDIIDDVTDKAGQLAADLISSSISEVVADNYMKYVAVVNCSTPATNTHDASSGTASGFVIGVGEDIYLVTNAHVVMTPWTTNSGSALADYEMHEHTNISCVFELLNPAVSYKLEVIAYGTYTEKYNVSSGGFFGQTQTVTVTTDVIGQPDLAVCRFVGAKPDFTTDGSDAGLSIATDEYVNYGDEIAIVGNPQGIGLSITVGNVAKPNLILSGWGAGTFIMTDGAINAGNSGGAMINKSGQVVGVVESKIVTESVENMGFGVSSQSLIDFIEWANEHFGVNIVYSTN